MASPAFHKLFRQNPGDWEEPDLAGCNAHELQALCILLNVPHSGKKADLRTRLFTVGKVRGMLSAINEPGELVAAHRSRELAEFCRTVGVTALGTKQDKAMRLINWRNECRAKGQAALADCRERLRAKPNRQRRLFPV